MAFLFGFLAGVLANQVFGMATRLLPAKWVRYNISIDSCAGLGGHCVANVVIEPPRWRRALMEPLNEHVIAVTLLDDRDYTERALWIDGYDKRDTMLVNGGARLEAQLFDMTADGVYYSDHYPEGKLDDGPHDLNLVIRRVMDGLDADEVDIKIDVTGGSLEIIGFRKRRK